MFGLREEFVYFQCHKCGCLQISEQPKDISKYYSKDFYYSFLYKAKENGNFKQLLKKLYIDGYYRNLVPAGAFIKGYPFFKILKELKISNRHTNILDIGCGNGNLIRQLYFCGYKKVTGIDPFIENEIAYGSVKIHKTDVFNFKPEKPFDMVMMHHSFEHIAEQHETLQAIRNILDPDGLLLIRIPLCDCFAFRKYRENWFQIDAPRHFFVHSVKSMQFLCKKHGYKIDKIIYDSTETQFIESEKYSRDITLSQQISVSPKRLKVLKKQAEMLNNTGDGDMACFVLRKTDDNLKYDV
jgi:2-polyprenyl-3-methyl-5-hydroxy-6-metoxy-1,4-benzoquinol methylase